MGNFFFCAVIIVNRVMYTLLEINNHFANFVRILFFSLYFPVYRLNTAIDAILGLLVGKILKKMYKSIENSNKESRVMCEIRSKLKLKVTSATKLFFVTK